MSREEEALGGTIDIQTFLSIVGLESAKSPFHQHFLGMIPTRQYALKKSARIIANYKWVIAKETVFWNTDTRKYLDVKNAGIICISIN